MFKVGIILVSNREDIIRSHWLRTLKALNKFRDKVDIGFSFVLEEPISLTLVKEMERLGNVSYKKKIGAPVFNWIDEKDEACRNIDAEYWLNTDDDFLFDGVNTTGNWTTAKRYMDAVVYLDNHPECGYVMMDGFMGGHAFGKEIRQIKSAMFSIARGSFLRNVSKKWTYARPELNRAGALDETSSVYSRLEEGYFAARGFNTPVHKTPTKRLGYNHTKIEYDNNWVYKKGIGAAIRKHYDEPDWKYEAKKLPRKLRRLNDGKI
jgi:hypothetical protein